MQLTGGDGWNCWENKDRSATSELGCVCVCVCVRLRVGKDTAIILLHDLFELWCKRFEYIIHDGLESIALIGIRLLHDSTTLLTCSEVP